VISAMARREKITPLLLQVLEDAALERDKPHDGEFDCGRAGAGLVKSKIRGFKSQNESWRFAADLPAKVADSNRSALG
jgi:hypothetical protein